MGRGGKNCRINFKFSQIICRYNMPLDLEKIKKIHLIGIGGIIMSALARYFLSLGKAVSGSDRDRSEITEKLEQLGATVYKGHAASNLGNNIDLVVYTEAISKDNQELIRARDLQLPTYSVYQVLGGLSQGKYTVAVAGMHGKSTTTSMVGLILEAAGLNPTVFVGTQLKEFDGNLRLGKSQYLVSEACEYRDNFLNYQPNIGVVTNIEAEHLDYFKNIAGVKKSFKRFISQIKNDGWLVFNGDDKHALQLAKTARGNKISFGVDNQLVDFRAASIEIGDNGDTNFTLASKKLKEYDGIRFSLKVPGNFNVYNALAAISVAAILAVKVQVVQDVLSKFNGVWRRFEFKGEREGIQYFDDYAHHPTEIRATLKAAKQKFGNRTFWLVYQPHLYSRTNDFLNEFAASLNLAPDLILAPIYAAREENKWGITSKDLADLMNKKFKRPKPVIYLPSLVKIRNYLKKHVQLGEVVMTMGAGDVYKIINK
ncbi:UDP-N-acetylmuramate--L-alanine ligase [Candidatus Kuenenbacteria bacterium CG_4_10_14_3_um_filter_39_14]|uniref:UDP-N-acetylmuramate--L-alanine ligase n=1 Tax=Candidatus Kuenenbacteria bacterium CG_4_10_14_3_um_filter_39_14 TaxID=1974614 RepID=A0A2M7MHY6_9BACT|nr:MAG: UDP-N-acetylmuramate--L-alanine ligase [Candidatus Kuenenbacteria bacterium CG_4_10_14_3_um_filter_39_14]